jgi:outer membrane protein, multidrug efflux system
MYARKSSAVGLPSAILERRPDVRGLKKRGSANANVGVAKADYFPQIPLTANVGSQRRALTNFLKGPPAFWAIGAQLAQSIYVGGKITSKPYSKHS